MNIIEELKKAIEKKSWESVASIYKQLTGIQLNVNPDIVRDQEKINVKLVVSLLNSAIKQLNTYVQGYDQQQESQSPDFLEEELDNKEDTNDVCKKSDVNELLKNDKDEILNGIPTNKKNHYGDTVSLITGEFNPSEAKMNEERAKKATQRKTIRPKPKVYERVCTKCGKSFDSPLPPLKEVGTNCPECLKNSPRSH